MLRYSDGEKQRELSNESQDHEITTRILRENEAARFPITFAASSSGREPDRSQLELAYADIKRYNRSATYPITCLILLRWDRWFRNSMASVRWVGKFEELGVEVNTVERWIDFSQITDKMLFFLEQAAAEKVSQDISDHVIRNQKACLRDGYYPYQISKRYQRRVITKEKRYLEWTPSSENLRQAGIAIANGAGITEAYYLTGGEEVHGHIDSFSDNLRNRRFQAKYNEFDLDFPPLWNHYDWQKMQRRLLTFTKSAKGQRNLEENYLKDIIYGGPCNQRASTSPVKKKRNGKLIKTYNYYICACKPLRHYRFRREEVHERLTLMLAELTLVADKQKRLAVKAKKRASKQTGGLKKELRKKTAELKDAETMVSASLKAFLRGHITLAEKSQLVDEVENLRADVAKTKELIQRQGEILEKVLLSIKGIGAVLSRVDSKLQLRDFLRMAFPEGLEYVPEIRTFRAIRMNVALSTIDTMSASYRLLKVGAAANATAPLEPTGAAEDNSAAPGGFEPSGSWVEDPGKVELTVKSDLVAFHRYCDKYAVA